MNKKLSMSFVKAIFSLVMVSLIASLGIFSTQSVSAQANVPAGDLVARAKQVAALRTNQIIIQYKTSTAGNAQPESSEQMQRLSQAAGVPLQYDHAMSGNSHVLRLPSKMSVEQVQAIATSLMALSGIEYAEPDRIVYHTIDPLGGDPTAPSRPLMLTPNDPLYGNQWALTGTWGINAPAAWNTTTGSSSVVVAVIDTGITNHAEFAGRTVAGYDFIGDSLVANDGNGRDSDPSDPGDWITTADSNGSTYNGWFAGCSVDDSSWHGTHTAGTIGATSNNGLGVAGINWYAKIEPVRVLGKCGGYTSDIVDGMRWAAGLSVPGVPANANPAKVLSISLGGSGACSASEQNAVTQVTAAGTVVVVAAGNSASNVSGFSPANCNGVITVAATGPTGDQTYYSNFGSQVEISAPGGEQSFANDPNGILSTLNTGLTSPAADTYINYQGTSMATPHVSGVVSLLFSINPSLTPAQVLTIIQGSAKAFPGGATCNTSICGSGILNADAAVKALGTATFNSNGALDGWLLESSENSDVGGGLSNSGNLLLLGDNATNQQYRSVLSFNTASLPDTAVIMSATLKVKQQAIVGAGNPVTIFQGFMASIKLGFFGTAAGLQAPDFQAAASQTYGPASPVLSGGLYNISLTNGKAYINKLATNGGVTQVRLRFKLDDNNNSVANYLAVYSGDTPTAANRPKLVITYYVP